MSDFAELYQEIILDHYRSPRGAARLDEVAEDEVHDNPTCGDSLKLRVDYGEDGRIAALRHETHGCAISVASASMMSMLLEGKTPDEALDVAKEVEAALRGEGVAPREFLEALGDLAALGGVVAFPLRIKCASLAWHALERTLTKPTIRSAPPLQDPDKTDKVAPPSAMSEPTGPGLPKR